MPDRGAAPRVVALGGGHGLAVALRAIRRYAVDVTAVVSVADDGGSSGRLRRDLGIAPPGDLRTCLVALAEPGNLWAAVFAHRFASGELDGHSVGNLVLAGLLETLGDLGAALDAAADLLGVTGRVLPATTERVVLKAHLAAMPSRAVEGQVAVANAPGRIRRVELVPRDVPAPPEVLEALARADQIVLAPGSLYTSLLPVLAVPEIRAAVAGAAGQVVQVCNLAPQVPETEGLDAVDHLRVVVEHGGRVDRFLYDRSSSLRCDPEEVGALHAVPVVGEVAGAGGHVHDPARLAEALSDLLESGPGPGAPIRDDDPDRGGKVPSERLVT